MALENEWIDKVNGEDDINAEDINLVAHAEIENERKIRNLELALEEMETKHSDELNAIKSEVRFAKSAIQRNSKRIYNLEFVLWDDKTSIDDSVAYRKTVPANALPYAEVTEVGGMSHRSVNLFDDALLTSKGMEKVSDHEYLSRQPYTSSGAIYTNATKEAGVYSFSAMLKFVAVSGVTSAGIYCQVLYTDGTTTKYPLSSVVYDRYVAYSFSTSSAKVVDNIQFTYGSNAIATYIKDVMLVKGSEAIPFKPYYEGLRNASVTALKSEGANVSPITTPQSGYFYDTSGGQSGANASYVCFIATDVKELTEYTVSSNLVINSIWYDDGVNPISRIVDMRTFTTPVGCKRLRITLRNTSGAADTSAFEWFMINYGAETLPYVPYVAKHILPIPAEVQALEGWGMGVNETYHNRIVWDPENGVKQYRQEVARVRLPSDAGGYNSENNWYDIGLDTLGVVLAGEDVLCNLLPSVNIEGSTTVEGICINYAKTHVILRINGFADQASYRAWLEENEVYIIGRLATPIITDLTDILPDDNFIEVEGGGTITAVNEHELATSSSVVYKLA